jgi:hypothetical protein
MRVVFAFIVIVCSFASVIATPFEAQIVDPSAPKTTKSNLATEAIHPPICEIACPLVLCPVPLDLAKDSTTALISLPNPGPCDCHRCCTVPHCTPKQKLVCDTDSFLGNCGCYCVPKCKPKPVDSVCEPNYQVMQTGTNSDNCPIYECKECPIRDYPAPPEGCHYEANPPVRGVCTVLHLVCDPVCPRVRRCFSNRFRTCYRDFDENGCSICTCEPNYWPFNPLV